ncbi:hypothetical protein DFR49_3353 [Hephaestia caeni]|uniref:Lipoprotein n=1 Tax=Hephaestia caeni TaxID=645617 RepID=A0A397NM69_9SPHN|nr:hypothetical protein [Hephaestia caeni]RIA37468.1 hypothetical protein DFR49_3353 [Hephaestia caeni]
MKMIWLTCVALAGCAGTVSDVRSHPVFFEAASAKSLGALSQCLADKWSKGEVNSVPRERGVTITVGWHFHSSPVTEAVVDIDDLGETRRVTLRVRKEHKSLREDVKSCL